MNKLKVLFVVEKFANLEMLSIPILSAIAKKAGHEVKLLDYSSRTDQKINDLIAWAPDLAAYSICSDQAKEFIEMNLILKEKMNFVSFFGGPHPTFEPKFIENEGVDIICRGEGDEAFTEVLKNLHKDSLYDVKNCSFKTKENKIIENDSANLIADLDEFPFPDRDIIYSQAHHLRNNTVKAFTAARGCPYKCSYCFNHAYNEMFKGKGRIVRTKSVDYIIKEIKIVRDKYPLNFVKFHDDIFGVQRDWLQEFAVKYPSEINLPFICYVNPNMVNEKYAHYLSKAGCSAAIIAIECGNERIRNEILDRNVSNDQIMYASKTLKKQGIKIYALNMVGLPTETVEDMISTIKLNNQANADFSDAFVFQPYPGTGLTEYCQKNGFLSEDFDDYSSNMNDSPLNFSKEFKDKVYIIHKLFLLAIRYPVLLSLIPIISKMIKLKYTMKSTKNLLKLTNRFAWGFFIRNIYTNKFPLKVLLHGLRSVLFSKDRL